MLQHPGGKSSVQLGWEDSPKKEDKPKEDADVAKGGGDTAISDTKKDVKVDGNVKGSKSGVSSNAFATGNVGNFLTDKPTSRVSQPPGGKSSFSLY